MPPTGLSCPYCSAPLRIGDRRLIGRQADCPDCGHPILILADGPRNIALSKVEPAAADEAADVIETSSEIPASKAGSPSSPDTCRVRGTRTPLAPAAKPEFLNKPGFTSRLSSATGIAWTVAIVAAVVVLAVAWPFSAQTPDDGSNGRKSGTDPGFVVPAGDRENGRAEIGSDPRPQPPADNADDLPGRLELLGGRIMRFVDEHERYPAPTPQVAGLTERQRLSWMAELVADSDAAAGARPQWDQPWRDVLNDQFVRRQFPEFLNPSVKQLTGPDGYPATHFVGVAGVGEDGPSLAVNHPRAGVFGVNRRTRIEDITDGQANTIMLAGVIRDVASWAAGGPATMRPLTKEPYINGEDGFGTGQKDGMHVLMADGSVRFLSVKTDPRLIRRMAAMADGLPLDANVPGEPGDAPPRVAANDPNGPAVDNGAAEPQNAIANEPPVPAPVPPKVIDVAGLLSQKIASYEQQRAAPFLVVLREVEEMAGVPIRVDEKKLGAAADRLKEPISLRKLENTTVGDILAALVERAGFAFVIERDGIRIESPDRSNPR